MIENAAGGRVEIAGTRRSPFPERWGRPPTPGDSLERRAWIAEHCAEEDTLRPMRMLADLADKIVRSVQFEKATLRGHELDRRAAELGYDEPRKYPMVSAPTSGSPLLPFTPGPDLTIHLVSTAGSRLTLHISHGEAERLLTQLHPGAPHPVNQMLTIRDTDGSRHDVWIGPGDVAALAGELTSALGAVN